MLSGDLFEIDFSVEDAKRAVRQFEGYPAVVYPDFEGEITRSREDRGCGQHWYNPAHTCMCTATFEAFCALRWVSPFPNWEWRQWPLIASSPRGIQWGGPLIGERNLPAQVSRSRAVCVAQELQGDVTRCMANVDGTALPVDLPTAVLRGAGVIASVPFEWRIREDGTVTSADISLRPPAPTLSREERAEIERLYEKHKSDQATDVWGPAADI